MTMIHVPYIVIGNMIRLMSTTSVPETRKKCYRSLLFIHVTIISVIHYLWCGIMKFDWLIRYCPRYVILFAVKLYVEQAPDRSILKCEECILIDYIIASRILSVIKIKQEMRETIRCSYQCLHKDPWRTLIVHLGEGSRAYKHSYYLVKSEFRIL